jgi:uncharacterized membrane protein
MSNKVTETHMRSVAKLSIYKIISMVVSYFLSMAFGANPMQALFISFMALTVGSLHYYLYERLCLFVRWGRDELGHDSKVRSFIKTLIFRITALIITAVIARNVFLDDNWLALLMASTKFITNALTYFTLERVFDRIQWGKISTTKEETI